MSHDIAERVRQLDATLPPELREEGKTISLTPVAFHPEDDAKGEAALFYIDDFMHATEDETVYFVRPRTKRILDTLGIRYRIGLSKTGTEAH